MPPGDNTLDLLIEADRRGILPPEQKALLDEAKSRGLVRQEKGGAWNILAGPDMLATAASGAVAAPLAGAAGIAGAVLPGPEGQGAEWAKKTQSALTYQPRTRIGKLAADIASVPFNWLHRKSVEAGEAAQDAGAPPSIATAVQTGIETLPATLPAIGSRAIAARAAGNDAVQAARAMRNEVRDATYDAARAEGYKFPASATSDSMLNRRIEGVAGRNLANHEFIMHNQEVTNKIAAREVGLPENTAITVARLEKRRSELAEPYREASALDPAVAQDVLAMRSKRAEAQKWYAFYEKSKHPRAQAKADKLLAESEAAADSIESAAQNYGVPNLIDRIREARTQIAKTYDVQDAIYQGSGNVSAAVLGRKLDNGKRLSGGLKTIADAHQSQFGPYLRDADRVANPVVPSQGQLGNLIVGASQGGLHAGWLAHGLPMLSGPTRSLVMTDAYQNAVGRPTYPTSALTPGLAQSLGLAVEGNEVTRR